MQKQIVSFSRTLSCLALVALFIFSFSANSAIGQTQEPGIWIDLEKVSSPYSYGGVGRGATPRPTPPQQP